jgi:hypothetical protein
VTRLAKQNEEDERGQEEEASADPRDNVGPLIEPQLVTVLGTLDLDRSAAQEQVGVALPRAGDGGGGSKARDRTAGPVAAVLDDQFVVLAARVTDQELTASCGECLTLRPIVAQVVGQLCIRVARTVLRVVHCHCYACGSALATAMISARNTVRNMMAWCSE